MKLDKDTGMLTFTAYERPPEDHVLAPSGGYRSILPDDDEDMLESQVMLPAIYWDLAIAETFPDGYTKMVLVSRPLKTTASYLVAETKEAIVNAFAPGARVYLAGRMQAPFRAANNIRLYEHDVVRQPLVDGEGRVTGAREGKLRFNPDPSRGLCAWYMEVDGQMVFTDFSVPVVKVNGFFDE